MPSVWNRGRQIQGVRFERTRTGYFPLPALSFVLVCFGFLGFFAFLSIVVLQGCPLVAAILARPPARYSPGMPSTAIHPSARPARTCV
jgi:hypothetical protein